MASKKSAERKKYEAVADAFGYAWDVLEGAADDYRGGSIRGTGQALDGARQLEVAARILQRALKKIPIGPGMT